MVVGMDKASSISSTVTPKGQVTIPKNVRDTLGIKAHDRVFFIVDGDRAIVRPILWFGRLFRRDVEGVALDGGSRGVGATVGWVSQGLRALQTGYARNYALAIFLGAALIVLYYVIRP